MTLIIAPTGGKVDMCCPTPCFMRALERTSRSQGTGLGHGTNKAPKLTCLEAWTFLIPNCLSCILFNNYVVFIFSDYTTISLFFRGDVSILGCIVSRWCLPSRHSFSSSVKFYAVLLTFDTLLDLDISCQCLLGFHGPLNSDVPSCAGKIY
jgi:hypothetical protein